MSAACTGEPLSWLRLERHALGELPEPERAAVDVHLRDCAACRACADRLREPRSLPVLAMDSIARARAARRQRRRSAFAATALSTVAAAAALVVVLEGTPTHGPRPGAFPPARVQVKGGELAITLVRDRAGVTTRHASTFAAGDRFKVLVTCPPPGAPWIEVMVRQENESSFPLGPAREVICANEVALDGAFALTGPAPAVVCVKLGGDSACARLDPTPASPE